MYPVEQVVVGHLSNGSVPCSARHWAEGQREPAGKKCPCHQGQRFVKRRSRQDAGHANQERGQAVHRLTRAGSYVWREHTGKK